MIRVVTTCSLEGWEKTGRRAAATFLEHWPRRGVELWVYAEGFDVDVDVDGAYQCRLPQWFLDWKDRHRGSKDAHGRDPARNPPRRRDYNFKRDCVRFAHKVAAIVDAAQHDGLLVWMDADVHTTRRVDEGWARSLLPEGKYVAWLDRARLYPECGFLVFDARHQVHQAFVRALRKLYESDAVFALPETHDSYVIEQLVRRFVARGDMPEPHSLSGKGRIHHHVFPHSVLGARMEHAKGRRKG